MSPALTLLCSATVNNRSSRLDLIGRSWLLSVVTLKLCSALYLGPVAASVPRRPVILLPRCFIRRSPTAQMPA